MDSAQVDGKAYHLGWGYMYTIWSWGYMYTTLISSETYSAGSSVTVRPDAANAPILLCSPLLCFAPLFSALLPSPSPPLP